MALALAALVMVGCPSSTDGGTDTGTNPGTDTGTDTGTETPQKYRAVKTGTALYHVGAYFGDSSYIAEDAVRAQIINWLILDDDMELSWPSKRKNDNSFPDYVYREQPDDLEFIPPPNGALTYEDVVEIRLDKEPDYFERKDNGIFYMGTYYHYWIGGWHYFLISVSKPFDQYLWPYESLPQPEWWDDPRAVYRTGTWHTLWLEGDVYEWEPIE